MLPEEIPWNIETPPDVLVQLVESGEVKPCKTIDFGCGAGNYAIYLAGKGFDATGVDFSPTAIQMANENAQKKGVSCHFLVADVVGDLNEVTETFYFAYDWECCIICFRIKGGNILKMFTEYYVQMGNTFLFVSVKWTRSSVEQTNTGKPGWAPHCIFPMKMN